MQKIFRIFSLAICALVLSIGFSAASAGVTQAEELRGNPDSKIYHNSTCQYYKAKNSTVVFKSEAEAQAKGFKPCSKCFKTSAKAPYIGNPNSKIFHRADCKFAEAKNSTVSFSTPEEAVKQGYKPCQKCLPAKAK